MSKDTDPVRARAVFWRRVGPSRRGRGLSNGRMGRKTGEVGLAGLGKSRKPQLT